jgi:DNA-binding CsgD family transcriptional regulator
MKESRGAKRRPRQRLNGSRSKGQPRKTRNGSPKSKNRSTAPLAKLSARSNESRNRALHALTAMRHGASLADAAKSEGVSQRTIRKYVGSALRQDHVGGRIRAVPRDRFTRYLQIPGPDGPIQVTVKGSKDATELAAYVSARAAFLRSGDESLLRRFDGKKIGGHALVTDPKILTSQAEQGESFDQLYSSLVGS